jgi:ribosomal protein S18 acetylase RimI-like enzyme
MIEKKKYNDIEILSILQEFDSIFPHLKEKVTDYHEYAKKIADKAEILLLSCSGENVGLCVYYANDFIAKTGYITLIGAKKEFQNLGLGRLLLSLAIKDMKKRGLLKVCLEVDKDNFIAQKFYKKFNFYEISSLKPKSESIFMEKIL